MANNRMWLVCRETSQHAAPDAMLLALNWGYASWTMFPEIEVLEDWLVEHSRCLPDAGGPTGPEHFQLEINQSRPT